MPLPILICDDSGFARRQMARVIPDGWDVDISFAEHGEQALEMIKLGKADLMFLDLNMPVMDGYETMKAIREQDLPTMVIVVSGDVQSEARERMLKLGAIDFISKPVDNERLVSILKQYGIYTGEASSNKRAIDEDLPIEQKTQAESKIDAFQELANVAMGRAGEKLADLLGVFIKLPIPHVNYLDTPELNMAFAEVHRNDTLSAVSQGFVSAGINGEALVTFNDSCFNSMVKLLNYRTSATTEELELEALIDVSNILIGACLNAIAFQLHVEFTYTHPIVLGRHCELEQLLDENVSRVNKVLAIEIGYSIEKHDVNFDLLLLFPDSAMDLVYDKLTAE